MVSLKAHPKGWAFAFVPKTPTTVSAQAGRETKDVQRDVCPAYLPSASALSSSNISTN